MNALAGAVLGVDPGSDKAGFALLDVHGAVIEAGVVPVAALRDRLQALLANRPVEALALGRPVILAGVAYGPDGPGVVRCAPDPASMRAAVESLATLGPVAPVPPLTVERAADRFLAALGA